MLKKEDGIKTFFLFIVLLVCNLVRASTIDHSKCTVSAQVVESNSSGELNLLVVESKCNFLKSGTLKKTKFTYSPWDFEKGQILLCDLSSGTTMGPQGLVKWIEWKVIQRKDKNNLARQIDSLSFLTDY